MHISVSSHKSRHTVFIRFCFPKNQHKMGLTERKLISHTYIMLVRRTSVHRILYYGLVQECFFDGFVFFFCISHSFFVSFGGICEADDTNDCIIQCNVWFCGQLNVKSTAHISYINFVKRITRHINVIINRKKRRECRIFSCICSKKFR